MRKIDELKKTDLEILEEIHQSLLLGKYKLLRGLEILSEDIKRQRNGLDIPEFPDDTYGKYK